MYKNKEKIYMVQLFHVGIILADFSWNTSKRERITTS